MTPSTSRKTAIWVVVLLFIISPIGRPRGEWRFGMCCGSRTGRKEDMEAGRKVNLLQPTRKETTWFPFLPDRENVCTNWAFGPCL